MGPTGTSFQVDLLGLEGLAETAPLKAIDAILECIPRSPHEELRQSLRRIFCVAILRQAGVPECAESECDIFDRDLNDQTRLFASLCLLRLLASSEDWCLDAAFRSNTFKLFDSCLNRPLYGPLKLNAKTQPFEKERILRSFLHGIEHSLQDSLAALDVLDGDRWEHVSAGLHDIRKALGKSKLIIASFVDKTLISGARLEELSIAVQEYFLATEQETIRAYDKCKSILERYLLQAQQHGSRYSREYLAVLGIKLLQICVTRFEKSGVSAPASIRLKAPEKRYPFYSTGASLHLSFLLSNSGPGYAFDVYCRIKNIDDAVEVAKPELFLGDLAPRPIMVEFPVKVVRGIDTLLVELEWEWVNFDRTVGSASEIVELISQPSGIDWDGLILQEPYRLDPVANDDGLIGRTEILERLIAHAAGSTVGSSCIYGQKRVGKTSIANAVRSRLMSSGQKQFRVIYVESGHYVHQDANRTIEQLGVRLCKQLRQADGRFMNLHVPAFDGALTPVFDILDEATTIAPDLRIVFIIDEFDKVPVDLFKRGRIGDAFFSTIRSISHMPSVGFILVGGERMQFVFDCQGEALNKFQMVRVDYFEKERHWTDFQDLIRRPVSQWLQFTDEAIVSLYTAAAGNPYFTVQICRSLFKVMVGRRDSHVTTREVVDAIEIALQNCSPTSFSHFWEDGILEPGPRQEERSMSRRQVLLALVSALKKSGVASREEIVSGAQHFGMDRYAVERELSEFVHRQILVHSGGTYGCKVNFFSRWLREVGPLEISTTFTDLEAIQQRKRAEEEAHVRSEEIVDLCSSWPPYKGRHIGPEQVRAWLEQVGDNSEQRVAFTMLQHLRFYSEDEVRGRMHEAHGIITRGLLDKRAYRQLKRSDVLVSYLDGAGKSGAHFARLYIEENGIYRDNLVEIATLSQAVRREGTQVLVFVDDFIGSGNSASQYLERLCLQCGDDLRASGLRIFLVAVAAFCSGTDKVASTVDRLALPMKIHTCEVLDDSYKCFSPTSKIFTSDVDRLKAKDLAYSRGVVLCKQAPLGYNDGQALVVFSHNCPNNSLPILWEKSDHWLPLFRRD